MNELQFGKVSPRTERDVVLTRKLLSQLRTIEDQLSKDCPEYLIHPDNVLKQEQPLHVRHKIIAFERCSHRLSNLWGLQKYNRPVMS